jgi:tetratricopeptide (TPR) repeat protein
LSVAWTARADEAAEAREHYKKATAHFAVGEFALAADAYQAAYLLKQDAALLFNAAQARRLGGENEKALILYKNYAQLYPKARNIPEVRDQIAKCEEAIAAAAKAKTAPPTNTVEPDKPMPEPTPPPAPAVAATPPLPPPSHERPVPVYKKWWLWTIVGGAVVVAVVVPVAVVASQPPPFSNVDDIANALVRW